MSAATLTLRIETPTGTLCPGRGFYQQDEEALYVQVGEAASQRRCFSFLEAETVRLDMDQSGRLMGIEVAQPRRRWRDAKGLRVPGIAEPADVRWLDFRERIPEPALIGNAAGDRLMLRFAASVSWRWYLLAENIHVQVDPNNRLAALLISDIVDDFAGRKISRFRNELARQTASHQDRTSHLIAK